MKDCTSTALLDSLNFCQGKTILTGIRERAYFIPKRQIVSWPTLPSTSAEMADLATYTGSFTLAADAQWKYIDLTLNKGQIEWETQGERPSRSILNKVTLYHPEIDEDAAAFQRLALGEDLVIVIRQRDGKYRVIGSEMWPIDIKPKGSTGEGTTGEAGSQVEVEATDVCPAPFYVGQLVTAEGTIECDTGALVEGV